MTPKDKLKDLLPAWRNLFQQADPDIKRFLRLVIYTLDPPASENILANRYPSKITLMSDGSSVIGHCQCQTASGLAFTDGNDDSEDGIQLRLA